jgi:hypothetical protein
MAIEYPVLINDSGEVLIGDDGRVQIIEVSDLALKVDGNNIIVDGGAIFEA